MNIIQGMQKTKKELIGSHYEDRPEGPFLLGAAFSSLLVFSY